MNRLNYRLRNARREFRHLRRLVILRNGGLTYIDPTVNEWCAKLEDEVRYLDAICESIRKGYRR